MAVFIDHPCKVDLDTIVDHAAWSHSDPIAALSSSRLDEKDREHFQVLFVNNEGGLILNSIINHSAAAKVMEWQPNGRILAIGWADGMVSCWVVDGKTRPMSTFSSNAQHSSEITVLKWNPAGKRLITGDKTGTLNVWIVDNRGTLTPSRQYRKRSHITAAVYCVLSPRHDPLKKMDWKKNYSPSFFFGTDRGGVIYADDLGHCTEVQQLSSSIDKMLFFEEKGRLVIITRSLLLTQYQVSEDGRVSRVMQVKMSVAKEVASVGIRSAVWAGPGLLAVATHEKMIRLLDLSSDESYNLSLSAIADIDKTDRVITVAFSPGDRYLAVGTQMGVVAIWKYCATFKKKGGEDSAVGVGLTDWELHYKTSLESSINNLYWGSNQGTVIAVTESSAVILSEAVMHTGMCGDLSVVQVSTMHVSIHLKMDDVWIENTRLLVRGIAVADSSFVVWDGKSARSCTINPQSHRSTLNEPFPTTSKAIAIADSKHLSDDALFIAENGIVKVTNYSGVQKGSITFSEAEGKPEFLHLNGKYLYVMTNNLIIKIYDVQKPTSPKALGSVMKFVDSNPDLSKGSKLKVRSICGNNTGSRLAILTSHVEGSLQVQHPDSRLHIYDRIKGSINVHDFSHESRYPASAHWDSFDSRLIAVEAVRLQLSKASSPQSSETNKEENNGSRQNDSNDNSNRKSTEVEGENEFEITLLFASSEHGILLQDSFPRQQPYGELIGINVPHVVFRNYVSPLTKGDGTPNSRNNNTVRLFAKTMRDFVGIDKVDEHTKHALLEFSFNLTLGKLDEAYRAVKAIDSPFIWENMAQMCVKTRRLDVAEVCLGNMGHARGAAALREAMKEGSAEVGLAVLAIQLGLLDDAAKLFREAERFDMLNKLYQAAGQWQKAVHLAEQKDRIHLKTTHYHYAKYLESIGDVSQAIRHYEDSETFRTEVPRMLYTTGQIEDLEEYVHTSRDVALLKWWASYLESKERYDKAKKYYTKAGDHLSLVRILCFQGDYQKAADIVEDSKSNAATYHFARQLEAQGELQEAIRYYASSGCYNHAIRLAKSYGMDSELMTFAIKSTPSLMLDCASHFEMKGDYEKAVQLYHKGGDYLHALDICFKAGQGGDGGRTKDQKQAMFDMLNTIAQDLGSDSSPQTLARCAEFLVIHKQFEKAVELYIMAKRYPQAIEMCAQHRVTITETMATTLTPPTEGFDPNERKEILAALGRALKKQGSFTLASKKYTQAGDRIRAMKCLLRGGDTKAVIQFASISRNAEIYKLAANYLQQMDWREADIMKAIITFYSKAKAFEQLAGFYDSCAQVEIDEYRDYEKAYRALKESLKYLREAKGAHIDNMITALEMRLSIIERFIEARKYSKTKPNDMVDICENLLEEPQLETAIRIGDCLGLLVEHFHECGDMKRAYQYMEDMKDRRILLHPYIDAQVLEDVHEAVGVPLNDDEEAKDGSEDELDDEIEEEVEEDVDEEEPRSPRFGNRGRNSSSKFRK